MTNFDSMNKFVFSPVQANVSNCGIHLRQNISFINEMKRYKGAPFLPTIQTEAIFDEN
jgi:hypothetical protein